MLNPSKSLLNEMHNHSNWLARKIKVRLSGDKLLLLHIHEITYFMAYGKYAYLHTTTKANKELIFHSLSALETLLPKSLFIRAGRSHLLNLMYIHKIDIRKKICTMQIDSNNSFDIKDLSDRAIKAIVTNDNLQVYI
jgi:DNA-binding LytR/AlgR family response regulator